ncbi:MAG: GNAT family N-acetyltransferase [Cyanobacteria bacterium REEB67]|nr:GNAT family N-acetyltransferase [Cyanobacteria bacterium REEB67]
MQSNPIQPTLRSERLVLRPHLESDLEAVHAFSSDADVCRYMQWGPNNLEQSRSFLEGAIANQRVSPKVHYDFVIVEAEAATVVGSFTLRLNKPGGELGEIGYVLAREAWGKGYASEAAELVMKFAFEDLKLHKISATCEPFNFASAKVLQKAGLVLEGYLQKHIFIKGQWRDTLVFGCVREDRAVNLQKLQLKPRLLTVGEVTAVPVPHSPGVSQAWLTSLFAGGSLYHLFMRAGSRLGSITNVLDQYVIVLNGTLTAAGRRVERGAILHCPSAVEQSGYEADSDVELLVFRLGPAGLQG